MGGPPCQPFSQAGKGAGRDSFGAYIDAIDRMAAGEQIDRQQLDAACRDPRAHHVLEPLRWALALRPQVVALEQVETVLPVWEATATALRRHGYRTWTGVVSCEQYGTPQTRRRAILLASLDRQPDRPPPTHERYVVPPKDRSRGTDELLLDTPAAGRIVHREDRGRGLLPWVSMGEALGWPADLILRNGKNTMSSSRHRNDMDVYERPLSAPAPTIDTHASRWKIAADGAHVDPPHRWKYDSRGQRDGTTIACDSRVAAPGHKGDVNGGEPGAVRQMAGSINLTAPDALTLQGFDPATIVIGNKTQVFRQIGNAMPPQLGAAALLELGAH